MNRLFAALALAILFPAMAICQPVQFQDFDGARSVSNKRPLPTLDGANYGPRDGNASNTRIVSVPATGVTNLTQHLPEGIRGVMIRAFGAVLIDTAAGLATGTVSVGIPIADGGFLTWDGLSQPIASSTFYICPTSTSAATVTMSFW
jgi:hypothetical protein